MKKFLKNRWLWIVGGCVLIAAIVLLLVQCGGESTVSEPTLIVETPQKLSASQTDEFTLDVTISSLGDARYPAMSMSIAFDSSRLEFLGVEEGNIFILSDENSTGQQRLHRFLGNRRKAGEGRKRKERFPHCRKSPAYFCENF